MIFIGYRLLAAEENRGSLKCTLLDQTLNSDFTVCHFLQQVIVCQVVIGFMIFIGY